MPTFPAGVHLKGGRNAAPVLAEMAREFYAPIIPIVMELHGQGLSLRAIAAELERRGIKSRHEWPRWSAAQVRRILLRGQALPTVPTQRTVPAKPTAPAKRTAPAHPAAAPPVAVPGFYLRLGGESRGPFAEGDVRAKLGASHIGLGTMARRDSAEVWRPLREVLGLPE